jgi:hypothetical protein
MTIHTTIATAALCLCLAFPATASTNVKPVAAKKPSAPKNAAATAAATTRTLDAIRIEGEIDVPQVLFITARDYRRFRDGVPAKYQVTSADIAKSIPLPGRLRLVAPAE